MSNTLGTLSTQAYQNDEPVEQHIIHMIQSTLSRIWIILNTTGILSSTALSNTLSILST